MKIINLLILVLGINLCYAASPPNFTVCDGKYALCTTAQCTPIPGKKGLVSCHCDVKTGYSAGTKPCQYVKNTPEGEIIPSRYYPIKSYVKCSNHRPWAWCLDKKCVVDKKDPTKASCTCTISQNAGDYIIVTETGTSAMCTTGLYSSATITEVNQMNEFLKTQEELQPFPIKVIQ